MQFSKSLLHENSSAMKYFYIALVVFYFLNLAAFFLQFEISYLLCHVSPDVVNHRSLSFEEYKDLQQAYRIRLWIGNLTLIHSIVTLFVSAIVSRRSLFSPAFVPKAVLIVSGIFAIGLVLVRMVHFVPLPPIR